MGNKKKYRVANETIIFKIQQSLPNKRREAHKKI
jgi:hypothetical protein